ncbi:MAG: peptide antibiotic transporter SbmA [Hyphomicrobiaceae bacterium]|nr:peptide antibiotic transporter SbmA [Hyphomicrobiaceae bacterium]MCC0024830.1 peptide antibiotic transporter SbmA [Hyphomicrobiaceae bacterium]
MFRSFFPEPRVFFPAALAWTALVMFIWFVFGAALEPYFSLGPAIAIQPTDADPAPFFNNDRVWLYEFVILAGYLFCIPWLFFKRSRWYWWSVVGSVTIIEVVYFNVQISAWLNDWYGGFYDLIQTALSEPNTVTLEQYFGFIWTVAVVLMVSITILVLNAFLNAHYLFRWRRAMTFYYMANWKSVRHIEGAAQRVQEDTKDLSSIVENLGLDLIDSIMTLIVFLPLLWTLSSNITELPWIGPVDGSLVWVALVSAIFGTVLLASVGVRLPGLAFHNQRVEAAFRKELVYGEDRDENARPPSVRDFFRNVQRNYFRLYFNYTYFNVARYAYLQAATFLPYIALAPSIVVAAITFGLFQQIFQAFGQVHSSFRFLVSSWTSIINLISIYKRLAGFESNMPKDHIYANDYDDARYLESWDKVPDPPTQTTEIEFQWALVREPQADRPESGQVTVWYDFTDKSRFPNSQTTDKTFPYDKELADAVRSAMDRVRGGEQVTANLRYFEQPERIKFEISGPGEAKGEAEVSHGDVEKPLARIRPIDLSFA